MDSAVNHDRRRFLAAVAAITAGLELTMVGTTRSVLHGLEIAADGPLAALSGATTWLNSPALTARDLHGKVVLIDFCTYTCINWLRTLPYLRAWAERYRDSGLVVIGVHTPEFGFESDLDNVRRAVHAMRIGYPVAIDNDYTIWNGFENRYWPALYLIDGSGVIRHRQFGEGGYGEAEAMIQRLVAEMGAGTVGRDTVAVNAVGVETAAAWDSLASPENYLGSERTERFTSTRGAATGAGHRYTVPARLRLNEWALAGDWTVGKHATTLNQGTGQMTCRFHARDLHLVMGPRARGGSVRCRIRIDGQPPGLGHGIDVDEQGHAVVTEPRLYQLIRQPGRIADRDCEIEFLDPGAELFALTFG